ncbi:MAG TPA: penicillin-binding protein 2, partial [Synergistaceae bacterium]|nr:penicillin-binding protein 2 [Synergistaceae bacterium]
AANVTGFVGEISEQELRTLSDSGYIGGDLIGKGGVERQHEAMLRGTPGEEYVEVDARGRKVKNLSVKQPGRGVDLLLSLDLGAQRLAVDLMKDYKGAIIVMDVKTGEVLVSYSSPSFDNNLLAWGVSSKEWDALVRDPANPMMDRTISGAYPPASTFKVLTALAALAAISAAITAFRALGAIGRRVDITIMLA